jgi:uncharacterized protein CbrC (UPF0167 family)
VTAALDVAASVTHGVVMSTGFDYFRGPVTDMAGRSVEAVECWYCGEAKTGFQLEFALCPDLSDDEREGKYGCADCLRVGRFGFWHDTDIGLLDDKGLTHVYKHNGTPPDGFSQEALVALRRTPQFLTWQQELWLSCCKDFMAYVGTWGPGEFAKRAPDGDGRKLFFAMTRDESLRPLWDHACPEGEAAPTDWYATYYAFQCRHCSALAGYWDCD